MKTLMLDVKETCAIESAAEGGNSIRIRIIKPGFNTSKRRYYPADVLARDCKVFEGVKLFADHPTITEARERPEGSVWNWVATMRNVSVSKEGALEGDAVVHSPKFMEILEGLRKAGTLGEMGMSIRALVKSAKKKVEGIVTEAVESIFAAHSVDFVTMPGAGGAVLAMESCRDASHDIISADYPAVAGKLIHERKGENGMDLEKQIAELTAQMKQIQESLSVVTKERDDAKAALEAAQTQAARDKFSAALETALSGTKLPDVAKARVRTALASESDQAKITGAIASETAYLAAVAGPVKGLGPDGKPITESDGASQLKAVAEASYRKQNPNATAQEVAAYVAAFCR